MTETIAYATLQWRYRFLLQLRRIGLISEPTALIAISIADTQYFDVRSAGT